MDAGNNNVAASFSCNKQRQQHQQADVPDQQRACPSETKRGCARLLRRAAGQLCSISTALVLFLTYSFVQTACRVRDRPSDMAFVVLAYADLAALFWCLRRVERLVTTDQASSSPAAGEERRRLQVAVWALSTVLSCAFAYRVSLVMPPVLVIVVWSMTVSVVLVGFYLLVVCKDQGYRVLDDDTNAGHGRAFQKIDPVVEVEQS
ncbi:hypothetical protein EJB05_33170, partial [Eragrostis curvula]